MRILFLSGDLMATSSAASYARQRGIELKVCLSPGQLLTEMQTGADRVLLDLGTRNLNIGELVASLRASEKFSGQIIAYAPHVLETALADAQAAGCDAVLTRGQFHANLSALLD